MSTGMNKVTESQYETKLADEKKFEKILLLKLKFKL